jgi:hypothetical protein
MLVVGNTEGRNKTRAVLSADDFRRIEEIEQRAKMLNLWGHRQTALVADRSRRAASFFTSAISQMERVSPGQPSIFSFQLFPCLRSFQSHPTSDIRCAHTTRDKALALLCGY